MTDTQMILTNFIHLSFIISHVCIRYSRNPELDPDNPSHEQSISHFLEAIVKEIELKANAMANDDPYFLRIKLLGAVSNFKVSSRSTDPAK